MIPFFMRTITIYNIEIWVKPFFIVEKSLGENTISTYQTHSHICICKVSASNEHSCYGFSTSAETKILDI